MHYSTTLFSAIFSLALAISVAMQLWLALRQMRHVRAHRGAVPAHFEGRISLAAHQKAADYTIARTRLAMADTVLEAVVLLALTFGGVLAWLAVTVARISVATLWQDVTLTIVVLLLSSLIALPFSWYRTFVIEQRFGFNRMTLHLWLIDLGKGALVAAVLGVPLLTLMLWLMARAGSLWWLYAWCEIG